MAKLNNGTLPKFGFKDKFGYGLGDLGCNLSFTLIGTFMADFYTQYIGISAGIWAVIIVLTKIWDGINDPIMGGVMDSVRISKSDSKFKPWMKIGAVGLIVTGALVFIPIPNASMWLKVTVCIITYLLWDISYTFLNVPYGALNSAITADPVERTQLSTWRSIGAGAGGLVCMLLPLIVYDSNNNIAGNRLIWLGLGMGVIAFFAYYGCLKLTTERVKHAENISIADINEDTPTVDVNDTAVPTETEQAVVVEDKGKYNYFRTLKSFLKNRPLIGMCLASFAMLVFFTSNLQTTKWLFQAHFGNAGLALTIAGIASVAPTVIFLPLVTKIVSKFGKKLATGVPLLLSVVTGAIMLCFKFPQTVGGSVAYVAGLMIMQFGGGLFQLVVWAMISDCIDYQQMLEGRREEGSVYAMYSLFRKLSQGVALSLPLLCMTWVGYNPQANPIGNQAPGVTDNMVRMAIGLMLIGAVLMAIALLFVYNLGKKETAELEEKLALTRSEIKPTEIIPEEPISDIDE